MADEQTTPAANAPEARTATGEIKDQQTPTGSQPEQKTTSPAESTTPDKTSDKAPDASKPDAKAGDKDAAKGPPEKYDFKAPEGYEIDAKVLEEATPVFKELGLNQEQAQKLFDIYSKHSIEAADAALKQYEAIRQGWRKDVIASPLGDGKEGLNAAARKNIDTAISAIGDEKAVSEFKSAMDLTGVGDHPAFVSAMAALGVRLSEGTLVKGAGPATTGQTNPSASAPRSAAAAIYPNLPTSSRS